jgi:hypothetical protein
MTIPTKKLTNTFLSRFRGGVWVYSHGDDLPYIGIVDEVTIDDGKLKVHFRWLCRSRVARKTDNNEPVQVLLPESLKRDSFMEFDVHGSRVDTRTEEVTILKEQDKLNFDRSTIQRVVVEQLYSEQIGSS